MHEQLRSDECAQFEMIPSLLQNFLAANIAGAAKHQVVTVYMYAMLPAFKSFGYAHTHTCIPGEKASLHGTAGLTALQEEEGNGGVPQREGP